MTINIKTHTCDITRNTSPGRAKPAYIVLHYTATNGATAKNEVDYFTKNPAATNASADFFVDSSSIWQYNTQLDTRYSWAVGDGWGSNGAFAAKCFNSNQISIEMSCTLRGGKWYIDDNTYKNAVELTRYLMGKYNIPADRVIRHHDVSGKLCPNAVGWLKTTGSEGTWKRFKSEIAGAVQTKPSTAKTDKPVNTPIYRVRKAPMDSTTQIGAYAVLANAKKQADANPGYKVYDMTGKLVYEPKSSAGKKSIDDVAREVIRGKWGNGSTRKYRLIDAGYDYDAVQKRVNELMMR